MIAPADTSLVAIRRWTWPALAIGIVAIAAGAGIARQSLDQLLPAYLVAWVFLWGISLGSLALVMIHHLTGGAWGLVLRRILEAQMRTLPVVALLFVPLALGANRLYPWAARHVSSDAAEVSADHRFQADYLRADFVSGRAIGYFVVWIAMAWLLSFWSRREDRQGGARQAWNCHSLSGPGLVIYGVTLHFASIDWMMSLDPAFTSTIYGPIVAAGQILSALALALVVLSRVARQPAFEAALSGKVLNDLGNLLLTLVLAWSYLVWCQAMLIWMADLRHDNVWWLARSRPGWRWLSVALALLGLVVPLFSLLFRVVKKNERRLGSVAILILLVQLAFAAYQLLPVAAPGTVLLVAASVLVVVGLIGLWLAAFLWLVATRPIVPPQDRNWNQARHLLHIEDEELAREEAVAHG